MSNEAWYHNMSAAMRERDRALTALARWQEALKVAEQKIQALRESDSKTATQPAAAAPHYEVPVVELVSE